jgi:hypothetical protein
LGEEEVLGSVVQAAPGVTRSPLRVGPVPDDNVAHGFVAMGVEGNDTGRRVNDESDPVDPTLRWAYLQ